MAFLVLGTLTVDLVSSCLPKYRFESAPEASCSDGELNGSEADTDCGGEHCLPCALGQSCREGADCALESCSGRVCQAIHCVDDVLDDGETDVDCGGDQCAPCGVSQRCKEAADCRSNACIGSRCVATGCDDGLMGGSETALDCGGGTCPPCSMGKRCLSGGDCATGICLEGQCSSQACADGEQSADEEGVDCGGACSKPCDPATACSNGKRDRLETDKDCGGGTCARCELDRTCLLDDDCLTNTCMDGRCAPNPCVSVTGSCQEPSQSGAGGSSGGSAMTGGAAQNPQGGTPAHAGNTSHGTGGSPSAGDGGTSPTGGAPATGGVGGSGVAGAPDGGASRGGSSSSSGGAVSGVSGESAGGTGPLAKCPGCARLSVPLSDPSDKANFVIALPNVVDLTRARLHFRVYREAGSGGYVKGYVQHSGSPDFLQLFQADALPISGVSGWTEFSWDVGAQSTTFDKRIVGRIGIQITAAGSSAWTNPTVIYLDSINVTGAAAGPWNFEARSSVSSDSTYTGPTNALWRNSGDYSVSGSSVSWFGD